MRLSELQPRWIHPNVFVFLCPHCQKDFLACKNIAMSERDQWAMFEKEFGEDWNTLVIPMKPEFSWAISGTIPQRLNASFPDDLTVTPSIDASASGHWHGFITNGMIT
jgi:hypothetical protein